MIQNFLTFLSLMDNYIISKIIRIYTKQQIDFDLERLIGLIKDTETNFNIFTSTNNK